MVPCSAAYSVCDLKNCSLLKLFELLSCVCRQASLAVNLEPALQVTQLRLFGLAATALACWLGATLPDCLHQQHQHASLAMLAKQGSFTYIPNHVRATC